MKIAASINRAALRPSATDIMNEPIAEGGLAFKFHIVGKGEPAYREFPKALFEALGTRQQIEGLALVAAKIGATVKDGDVISFKTRKRVASSNGLDFEIVEDAAPDRHATGYVILEVIGPRPQIEKLAELASGTF